MVGGARRHVPSRYQKMVGLTDSETNVTELETSAIEEKESHDLPSYPPRRYPDLLPPPVKSLDDSPIRRALPPKNNR